MIRVTLPASPQGPERTLGIAWKYPLKHEETKASAKEHARRQKKDMAHMVQLEEVRYTICHALLIHKEDPKHPTLLATGESRCSPLDNFTKEKGRKESLTRAIRALKETGIITKEESGVIWQGYLDRKAEDAFELDAFITEYVQDHPGLDPDHLLKFASALLHALV